MCVWGGGLVMEVYKFGNHLQTNTVATYFMVCGVWCVCVGVRGCIIINNYNCAD